MAWQRAKGIGRQGLGTAVVALALGGCGQPAPGATTDVGRVAAALTVDDSSVSMASLSDVATKRAQLRQFVFGPAGFPPTTRLPTRTGAGTPIGASTNLDHVDRLLATLEQGITNEALHHVPKVSNGRLVIIHAGHDLMSDANMDHLTSALLDEGYGVLNVPMPCWDIACPVTGKELGGPHNDLFKEKIPPAGQGNTIKYFVEDLAMEVNYLLSQSAVDHFPAYSEIDMTGLSGGGWTTTFYAALDPRIKVSIPCSGGKPMYLRRCAPVDDLTCQDAGGNVGYDGDVEQMSGPVFQTAGYLDLYALGASGAGRRQVQVQIRRDRCCFGEIQHATAANLLPRPQSAATDGPWDVAVRAFEAKLQTFLASSTDNGWYRYEIDETEVDANNIAPHAISQTTIVDMILAELDGDRRPFGAASAQDVYTKGLTGTLFHVPPSWTNTTFALVGAPSVVESGTTTHVVLRTPTSGIWKLTGTNGSNWQARALAGQISADPVAVLNGTRFDVFAMGNDRHLWHWWQVGTGSWSREQVSASVDVVGPPAVVASGTSRLDVITRRADGVLTHFKSTGGAWTTETMPGTFRGFPAAVIASDGNLRVYARGLDDMLTEDVQALAGGAWSSARLPDFAAGGAGVKMAGSPSASVNPTTQKPFVVTRGPAGNVERFEVVSGWVRTDEGRPAGSSSLTFSPVAVPGGFYARGVEGNVWFKSFASGWTWDAGQIY
jgi:hypothetical protein